MVFSVIARHGLPILLTSMGLVALLGCTPNKPIRTDVSQICTVDSDQLTNTDRMPSPCAHSSLEEVRVAAKLSDGTMKTGSYILGFTEFDDEGKTWEPQPERLIFALPEHRPLGRINAVRREVYTASSALRHGVTGVTSSEPDSTEYLGFNDPSS